jgi:GGDEF domain-containing protein
MMKDLRKNFSHVLSSILLFGLEGIAAYGLSRAYSGMTAVLFVGSLTVAGAFFFLLPRLWGFVWLVGVLSISGGDLVVRAWEERWTFAQQGQGIYLHFLWILLATALWVHGDLVRRLLQQNRLLEEKLHSLQKEDEVTGLLTRNEFRDRLETLVVGMWRRGEKGGLLLLSVQLPPHDASDALMRKLGEIALRSTRQKYDLVGKISEERIAIALQKPGKRGVQLVRKRFDEILSRELNESVRHRLSWEVMELAGDWKEVSQKIDATVPGFNASVQERASTSTASAATPA